MAPERFGGRLATGNRERIYPLDIDIERLHVRATVCRGIVCPVYTQHEHGKPTGQTCAGGEDMGEVIKFVATQEKLRRSPLHPRARRLGQRLVCHLQAQGEAGRGRLLREHHSYPQGAASP